MDGWGDAPIFLEEEFERAPGIPRFLWPTPPWNVRAALRNNRFIGWLEKAGGDDIFHLPEDTIMPKYANPYAKLRGLSLLSALELTNATDWGAIKQNRVYFENDVSAGVVFSTPEGVNLEDEDYLRLQQELITSRKGVGNAHKALVLQGGLKAEDMRKSNRDMQFVEARKFNREDVAMVEGVPKAELQLYEDINYATAKSADLSFWKKTLLPLMKKIQTEFNTSFFSSRGYECYFDIKAIDVLNDEALEKAQTARIFVDIGYTLNQVNDRFDLGFPEVEWGDEPQLAPALPPEEEEQKAPRTIGPALAILHRKLWIKITQEIQPTVSRASGDIRSYFKKTEKKILQRFIKRPNENEVHLKILTEEDFGWIDDLYTEDDLLDIVQLRAREAAETGIESIEEFEQLGFEPDPIVNQVLMNHGGDKIKGIAKNAAATVKDHLRAILSQAIDEGWTEDEAAAALAEGLKESLANVSRRARTIARTEIHGAYSQARYESMMMTDPEKLRWISTHDAKVRDTHEHLDGHTVLPGEKYSNGLRYPLDPEGSAGEVINCRCAQVAVYDEEE
jgi:SPP1 gp7 family putative phage head morphogenesis protein